MVDERFCLRVRNLPAVLSTDAVTSLLSHYGAVRVRVLHRRSISSGREPGAVPSIKTQKAIAVFKSREAQQNAQRRLHNLELAGQHLHVQVVGDDEESKDSVELKLNNADVAAKLPLNGPPPLPKGLPPPLPPTTVHASMQNSLYPPAPAPLAPHLGLNYAPSPLLEYKYPKATESIVRNIANVVLVQNIAATVDEKDLRSIFGYVLPLDVDLDSMEITFLPAKGSALVRYSDTEIATAAVDKLLGFQIEGNPLVITFQKAETSENIVSNDDIIKPTTLRWTTQDLANKRMPELQLSGEKVMKKYERGESSDTLYVKNLAKSVEFADLAAVFGACLPPDSTPEALDIRHFTTGRMKCQAFVKYPTVDLASNALHQVHGVVLKDKPLIVVRAVDLSDMPMYLHCSNVSSVLS
ncbi:phosphatidate cytidylyltransferase [Phytophthora boehmeriae]|uniref:Phosphatidate cytidylyltransferase n=1 Tax=Phytophthora boehmeriae TaxID=109152 RepID=A0A8T1VZ72_9STRA|nr:phosphatidate cytidylyltransferase [Phytophthora boehmeriae]